MFRVFTCFIFLKIDHEKMPKEKTLQGEQAVDFNENWRGTGVFTILKKKKWDNFFFWCKVKYCTPNKMSLAESKASKVTLHFASFFAAHTDNN